MNDMNKSEYDVHSCRVVRVVLVARRHRGRDAVSSRQPSRRSTGGTGQDGAVQVARTNVYYSSCAFHNGYGDVTIEACNRSRVMQNTNVKAASILDRVIIRVLFVIAQPER